MKASASEQVEEREENGDEAGAVSKCSRRRGVETYSLRFQGLFGVNLGLKQVEEECYHVLWGQL